MERVTVEKFALGVRMTHWLHGTLIIGFLILNRYTPQLCCGWDKPWSMQPQPP